MASLSQLLSAKIQKQLCEAAQGLKYLHGVGLVHGDPKGVGVSSLRDRFHFLTFVP